MKKRILGIGLVLALIVAMAIPMVTSAAPPTVASQVAYYTVTGAALNGGTFTRSTSPIVSSPITESISGGTVTLSISAATSYADCGFYLPIGTLGNLNGYTIDAINASGSPTTFGTNLYLGTNASGDFFDWTTNKYTGATATAQCLGPTSSSGSDVVSSSSSFYMATGSPSADSGKSYTLAELQAGQDAAHAFSSSTPVAIWIGITLGSGGSESLTISSLSITAKSGISYISGTVAPMASILSVTPPTGIAAWNNIGFNGSYTNPDMVIGTNYGADDTAGTEGTVTFVQGNDGVTSWTVTATCPTNYSSGATPPQPGNMWNGSNFLKNALTVSNSTTLNTFAYAGATTTFDTGTSASSSFPLYVQQPVIVTDAPGNYSIILIFTIAPNI